jgi:hypothetical protein
MIVDTLKKGAVLSTARIEVETSGSPWYGTTTVYARPSLDRHDPTAYYLVTCRHVVEGGRRAHLFFHRYDSASEVAVGHRVHVVIEDLPAKWTFHPNDEIISPLRRCLFSFLTPSQTVSRIFCLSTIR